MLSTPPVVNARNLIVDYYDLIPAAAARCGAAPGGGAGTPGFAPGFDLPALTDDIREFFAAATATWRPLGEYQGHPIQLMDLTGNPGTHTTKTFASMLIVARAVEHIRRTGESICIFTPTSANKGIALRDAVGRALAAGLVKPDHLSVVVLAPASTRHKFRSDRLAGDPALRRLSPLLRFTGGAAEGVKALGRAFVDGYAAEAYDKHGLNLWYSLDLRNYLVADAARAAFEADASPTSSAGPRWHAHAVSSAYGLLGYNLGRDVLEATGRAEPADRPGFLLVQHLGTPDMVLNLRHGSFSRSHLPRYQRDQAGGGWTQREDPHFPEVTDDPDEILDPTFYTHEPVTSPAMNDLIRRFGGDGIVVSRRECVRRYPMLRDWFAAGSRPLPEDPAQLREWSIVMALTGVLGAIDRGIVPAGHEIVLHGSGCYTSADYVTAEPDAEVSTVDEVAAAVLGGR
ncbi:DUF6002 family protein [Micromonospora sp. 4G57]|uniref:DUF6002 family protein n=1 Tax=Micromonospora sicca TaxID=2202420 RepID=A0ABU5J950_9ACTN|nr:MULTISPECIES: DUF6002 family protein [unclassified Micromonospora]MDZ5442296.1 DUF6002 family protein [Micromonospora sp. 4G57]MDZ5489101.1 DUF6002 family protein [Micromonospora sp. 4G53]